MFSLLYNINGLHSKLTDFMLNVNLTNVLTLTETNLDSNISDTELGISLSLSQYTIFWCDISPMISNKARRGGVLLPVHKHLNASPIKFPW